MTIVTLNDEPYYRAEDGTLIGPIIAGHVYSNIVPEARCPHCWRTAREHEPKAMRELADRKVVVR